MNIRTSPARRAFTLVELMVAIAIFSLLLAVVLIPLRAGLESFHVGKAKSETQGAAQVTLDQVERDLRRAVYVFPNTSLPGVTDRAPYTNNVNASGVGLPYVKSLDPSNTDITEGKRGVCDKSANAIPWGDTARLDILLAKRDSQGRVATPARAGDTIVSYYARRQNINAPYDAVDNPIVLFRAQFPFRGVMATAVTPVGAVNADTSSARFPSSCTSAPIQNRNALWLAHNLYAEPDLEPLCTDTADPNVSGSHTVVIPRGVGLVASQAYRIQESMDDVTKPLIPAKEAPLQPDLSFQLDDTNGDGKINRVTIAIALETFDANSGGTVSANAANKQPKGQIIRARRVIDLPNVR